MIKESSFFSKSLKTIASLNNFHTSKLNKYHVIINNLSFLIIMQIEGIS